MQTNYNETQYYQYEKGDIVTCYASWHSKEGEPMWMKLKNLPWSSGMRSLAQIKDRSKIEENTRMTLEIIDIETNESVLDTTNNTRHWGEKYTCFVHFSNCSLVRQNETISFLLSNTKKSFMRAEQKELNPGVRGAPFNPHQISNLYGTSASFNKDASSTRLQDEFMYQYNMLCNERRLRKLQGQRYYNGGGSTKPPWDDYKGPNGYPWLTKVEPYTGKTQYVNVDTEEKTYVRPKNFLGFDLLRCRYNPHARWQDWYFLIPNSLTQEDQIYNKQDVFQMNRWTFELQIRGSLISWMKETVKKFNGKLSDSMFGANGYVTLGLQRDNNDLEKCQTFHERWDKSIEFMHSQTELFYLPPADRPPLMGFFPFTAIKGDSKQALANGQKTNNSAANVFQVVCKSFPVNTNFNDKQRIPKRTWILTLDMNDIKSGREGIRINFVGPTRGEEKEKDEDGSFIFTIKNDFYNIQTESLTRTTLDSRNTALRKSWFNATYKLPMGQRWHELYNHTTTYEPEDLKLGHLDDRESYFSGTSWPTVSYHVTFGIVHKNIDVEIEKGKEFIQKRIFLPMTYIPPQRGRKINSFAKHGDPMPETLYAMMRKSILTKKHCSNVDPLFNKPKRILYEFLGTGPGNAARQPPPIWRLWNDIWAKKNALVINTASPDYNNMKMFQHCRQILKENNPQHRLICDQDKLNGWLYVRKEDITSQDGWKDGNFIRLVFDDWVKEIDPEKGGLLKEFMFYNVDMPLNKPFWLQNFVCYSGSQVVNRDEDWLFRLKPYWPRNETNYGYKYQINQCRLIHVNPLMKVTSYDMGVHYDRIYDWNNVGTWTIQMKLVSPNFLDMLAPIKDISTLFLTPPDKLLLLPDEKYTVHQGIFSRHSTGDTFDTILNSNKMEQRIQHILKLSTPSHLLTLEGRERLNKVSDMEKLKLKEADGEWMLKMLYYMNIRPEKALFKTKLYMFRQEDKDEDGVNFWSIMIPGSEDNEDYIFEQPLQCNGVLEFFNKYYPIPNENVVFYKKETLGRFLLDRVAKDLAVGYMDMSRYLLGDGLPYDIIRNNIYSVVLYYYYPSYEEMRISVINRGVIGTEIETEAFDSYQASFKQQIIISELTINDLKTPLDKYLERFGFVDEEIKYSDKAKMIKREIGDNTFNKQFEERKLKLKCDVVLMPTKTEQNVSLVDIRVRFPKGIHNKLGLKAKDLFAGRPEYINFPLTTKEDSPSEVDTPFMQRVNSVMPANWKSHSGYKHCFDMIENNRRVQYETSFKGLSYAEWLNLPEIKAQLEREMEEWWEKPYELVKKSSSFGAVKIDRPHAKIQRFRPHPMQMIGLTKHSEYKQPEGLPNIKNRWEKRCQEVLYHFIHAKKFLNIKGHNYWNWNFQEGDIEEYNNLVKQLAIGPRGTTLPGLPNPFILPRGYADISELGPGALEKDWNNMSITQATKEVKKDNHGKVGELLKALTLSHLQQQLNAAHHEWDKWSNKCKTDYMRTTIDPDILNESFIVSIQRLPREWKRNLLSDRNMVTAEYNRYIKTLIPRCPLKLKMGDTVYWDVKEAKRGLDEEKMTTKSGQVMSVIGNKVNIMDKGDNRIYDEFLDDVRRFKSKDIKDERDDEYFSMYSNNWNMKSPYDKIDPMNMKMFSEYECHMNYDLNLASLKIRQYQIITPGVISFISQCINRKITNVKKRLSKSNKQGLKENETEMKLVGLTTVQKICKWAWDNSLLSCDKFEIIGKKPFETNTYSDFSKHKEEVESITMSIGGSEEVTLFSNGRYNNSVLYDNKIKESVKTYELNGTTFNQPERVVLKLKNQKINFMIRFKDNTADNTDFCKEQRIDTLIKHKGQIAPRRGIMINDSFNNMPASMVERFKPNADDLIDVTNQWEEKNSLCEKGMLDFLHTVDRLDKESKMINIDYLEDKKVVAVLDKNNNHKKNEKGEFEFQAISLDPEKFKYAGTLDKIESLCRQIIENAQKEALEKKAELQARLNNGDSIEAIDNEDYEKALLRTPSNSTKCGICGQLGATVYLSGCSTSESKHVYHMKCIFDSTLKNYGLKGLSTEYIMVNLKQIMVYCTEKPPKYDTTEYDDWMRDVKLKAYLVRGENRYFNIGDFLVAREKYCREAGFQNAAKFSRIIPCSADEAVECGVKIGNKTCYFFQMYHNRDFRTNRGFLNEQHADGDYLNLPKLKTSQAFLGVTINENDPEKRFIDYSSIKPDGDKYKTPQFHGRVYVGLGAAKCNFCTSPYGTKIWCMTPVPREQQYQNYYSGQNAIEYSQYAGGDDNKPFTIVKRKRGFLQLENYKNKYILFKYETHGRAENLPEGAQFGGGCLEQTDALDQIINAKDINNPPNLPTFFRPIGYIPKDEDQADKITKLSKDSNASELEQVADIMKMRSYTVPGTNISLPDITKIFDKKESENIRRKLNEWLRAAQIYLNKKEKEYISDEIDWRKQERDFLIQKFKPVKASNGQPSNRLADIESKWLIKPTYRGGGISKRYAIREKDIPINQWRQPRIITLPADCTVLDFVKAAEKNLSNMYEIPTIPVQIPKKNNNTNKPWQEGEDFIPKNAHQIIPHYVTFKKVIDDAGNEGLEPKPGTWVDVKIWRPDMKFKYQKDDEEKKRDADDLKELKKRLRQFIITKCRDIRSGLGHTRVEDDPNSPNYNKQVYDPSKAIFVDVNLQNFNEDVAAMKTALLKDKCGQPLLEKVEGDSLPWPNPTKIFTPTVDMVSRKTLRAKERFKILLKFQAIDSVSKGAKGPIDLSVGDMVIDVGINDYVSSFAWQMTETQWFGFNRYFKHVAQLNDKNDKRIIQPIFPGEDIKRTLFNTEMNLNDYGQDWEAYTPTYSDGAEPFKDEYKSEKIRFENPKTGEIIESEYDVALLQDEEHNDREHYKISWKSIFFGDKDIDMDMTGIFNSDNREWDFAEYEDKEQDKLKYAKLEIDNPWKCTADLLNADTTPVVDPFTSTKYIIMHIPVPSQTRFTSQLSNAWKMEQMQQRGIIKPTDVLVAVKVETFDQEEGNRNAYYYPQHRATPVFAAMPQRLLDTSIKYVQDYRKAIQEWAIFMNFENYDKEIIQPLNQLDEPRGGGPEEILIAKDDEQIGLDNLYTDSYCYQDCQDATDYAQITAPEKKLAGFELAGVSISLCEYIYRKRDDGTFYPLYRVANRSDFDDQAWDDELNKYNISTQDEMEKQVKTLQAQYNVMNHNVLDTTIVWLDDSFMYRSWCTFRVDGQTRPLEGDSKDGIVIMQRADTIEDSSVFRCEILKGDVFYQGGINIRYEPTTNEKTKLNKKITTIIERASPQGADYNPYGWKEWNQREKLTDRLEFDGENVGWLDRRHMWIGSNISTKPRETGGIGKDITYQDCENINEYTDEGRSDKPRFRSTYFMKSFVKGTKPTGAQDTPHLWEQQDVELGKCPQEAVGKDRTFIKVRVMRHRSPKGEVIPPPPLEKMFKFYFHNISGSGTNDWSPFWSKWHTHLKKARKSTMRLTCMHVMRIPGRGFKDDEWPKVIRDLKNVYILQIMYAQQIDTSDNTQKPIWEVFTRNPGMLTPWQRKQFPDRREQYRWLRERIRVQFVGMNTKPGSSRIIPVYRPMDPTEFTKDKIPWSKNEKGLIGDNIGPQTYANDEEFQTQYVQPSGMFECVLPDENGKFSWNRTEGGRGMDNIRFNRYMFEPYSFGNRSYRKTFKIGIEFVDDSQEEICVENRLDREELISDHLLNWASAKPDRYYAWDHEGLSLQDQLPKLDDIEPRVGDIVRAVIVSTVDYYQITNLNGPGIRVRSSSSGGLASFHDAEDYGSAGLGIKDYYFVGRGITCNTKDGQPFILSPGDWIQLADHRDRNNMDFFSTTSQVTSNDKQIYEAQNRRNEFNIAWEKSYGTETLGDMARTDLPCKVHWTEFDTATGKWTIRLRRHDTRTTLENNFFTLNLDRWNDKPSYVNRMETGHWWYVVNDESYRKTGGMTAAQQRAGGMATHEEGTYDESSDDSSLRTNESLSTDRSASESEEDLMKRIKKLKF